MKGSNVSPIFREVDFEWHQKTCQANAAKPVVAKKAIRSFYLDLKKYNAVERN